MCGRLRGTEDEEMEGEEEGEEEEDDDDDDASVEFPLGTIGV